MVFKEYLKNLPELKIKTFQCQKSVGSIFNAVVALQSIPKPRVCFLFKCVVLIQKGQEEKNMIT